MHTQIFEAYGLGRDVVDTCFRGSVSRIGGMSLSDLQREAESFWVKGFPDKPLTKLEDYGFIQSKSRVRCCFSLCERVWVWLWRTWLFCWCTDVMTCLLVR